MDHNRVVRILSGLWLVSQGSDRKASNGRNQQGFTMIELICVIVILGVLAASAIPRMVDLRTNAIEASLDGYAGALQSAMHMNHLGCQVVGNTPTSGKCIKVNNCTDGSSLLQSPIPNALPGMDNSHLYINQGFISSSNGVYVGCSMELVVNSFPPVVYTRSFMGISAGN